MKLKPDSIGSSLDDFLKEEGIYEEVSAAAIKRFIADQIEEVMTQTHVSKSEMARRMNTSRASLERLLDPSNESVTRSTLFKAANAIGRHIRVELT